MSPHLLTIYYRFANKASRKSGKVVPDAGRIIRGFYGRTMRINIGGIADEGIASWSLFMTQYQLTLLLISARLKNTAGVGQRV